MENFDNDLNYYDLIIDINSFRNLYKNGWDVKASEKGLKNYENYRDKSNNNNKLTVIGVIGNEKVGKSFLLQKITGNLIPAGASINTKGLSVCYPTQKEKNYIILDSAGFQSPLLKNEFYKLKIKENEEKNEKEKEIEIQNEIEKNVMKTVVDKKLINYFLESFIIENSDILIFVLNQMTKSDQMFLKKVKKHAKNKTLIVVHNLKNFLTIEQCNYYIKNYLMNNLDFKLTEENLIIFNSEKRENENSIVFFKEKEMFNMKIKENEYYKQENQTEKVLHIFLANDNNNEAAKHFNKKSIEFIQSQILNFSNFKFFDVIEKIFEHLNKKQNEIFMQKIPFLMFKNNKILFDKNVVHIEHLNEKTTEEDLNNFFKDCGKIKKILIIDDEKFYALINFKNKNGVENCLKKNGEILNDFKLKIEWKFEKFKGNLKRVIEDYLGNEIFVGDVIVPFYKDYVKKNNDKNDEYIIEFEMPGNYKFKKNEIDEKTDEFKLKVLKKKKPDKKSIINEYVIIISGDKIQKINKKEINLRKYGKFKLNVERKFEGFYLEDKNNPEIKHKMGIHKYVWKIAYEKKKEEEKKMPVEVAISFDDDKKKKKKKKKEEKNEEE